jgi:hypothetical protein
MMQMNAKDKLYLLEKYVKIFWVRRRQARYWGLLKLRQLIDVQYVAPFSYCQCPEPAL